MRSRREQPQTRVAAQEGCLAFYEQEKSLGTEFPAIVGALQDFVEEEEQRHREEQQELWTAQRREDKLALQRRFLSGADCKWTQLEGEEGVYTRINGRAYRLRIRSDKRFDLERSPLSEGKQILVGTYESRGAASKALKTIAFAADLL